MFIEQISSCAISIYPNPGSTPISVLNTSDASISSYAVMDLMGKVFQSQNFENEVEIGNFNPGIYLLKLTTTKGTVSKKFIKD